MERAILLIFVCAIIGAGAFAGLVGFVTGSNDGPNPSQYVTNGKDCWVKPQGDPLYDEHYAQQVNPYNCNAFKVQAEAQQLNAETRKINVDTTQGIALAYVTFGIVALTGILLLFAVFRG